MFDRTYSIVCTSVGRATVVCGAGPTTTTTKSKCGHPLVTLNISLVDRFTCVNMQLNSCATQGSLVLTSTDSTANIPVFTLSPTLPEKPWRTLVTILVEGTSPVQRA